MDKKALNAVKYSLSFVLAAALVYFAFRKVSWDAFISGLRDTRWEYIALFILASIAALIFRNERWRLLMQALDPEVKRLDSWDATNIGNVANIAVPGAGEFLRCGYISNKRMNYGTTFGTMVCERAWDVLAILTLILIALAAKWESFGTFFKEKILGSGSDGSTANLVIVLSALLILGSGAIYMAFRLRKKIRLFEKISSALANLWDGFITFLHMRRKLLFAVYTIGIWSSYILMTYFVLRAMPLLDSLTIADAILISAMGNIASVIPVPGGIGAYHYIVALTLQSLYGADWDTGILFATLNHELHAVLVILLGIISYFRLTSSRRRQDAINDSR